MSTPVVQVEGARELRRTLRKAGDDLDDFKSVHREIGGIVVDSARPKTPRGFTGRLEASVRASGTKTAAVVRAGKARVPYAGPIHWGWPARNIRPQPWLTDAASQTEPRWTNAYMKHVERVLDKIKGANA